MQDAKPYHHGDLRNALVEAGLELLRTKGISGLSLRASARLAGVSANAPYRHFADAAALASAIAAQGFALLIDSMETATNDPQLSNRPALDQLGVGYFRFAQKYPDHLRLMFSGHIAPELRSDELQTVGKQAFDQLVATAAQIPDCQSPPQLALAAWSLIHGFSSLAIEGLLPASEGETPESLLARCQEIFKAGWEPVPNS